MSPVPDFSANDFCGVHYNSGISNYWFYLLSEGGSDVNDNTENYSVNGITIEKAEQIIIRAVKYYLTSNTNFKEFRTNTTQAAIDLYGLCSTEVRSLIDFDMQLVWVAIIQHILML